MDAITYRVQSVDSYATQRAGSDRQRWLPGILSLSLSLALHYILWRLRDGSGYLLAFLDCDRAHSILQNISNLLLSFNVLLLYASLYFYYRDSLFPAGLPFSNFNASSPNRPVTIFLLFVYYYSIGKSIVVVEVLLKHKARMHVTEDPFTMQLARQGSLNCRN